MNLGDPESAVPERVGKLRLLEKLIQPLGGRGLRGALDFGKQADLHVTRRMPSDFPT
jgi:hypothetical protein